MRLDPPAALHELGAELLLVNQRDHPRARKPELAGGNWQGDIRPIRLQVRSFPLSAASAFHALGPRYLLWVRMNEDEAPQRIPLRARAGIRRHLTEKLFGRRLFLAPLRGFAGIHLLPPLMVLR